MEINSNQNIVANENCSNDNTVTIDNADNADNTDNADNADNANNANNADIKYKMCLSEGIGWIGSVLVLIPYVVPFSKTTDFILNTLGASGLFVVCVTSKQYQSIVINAAWIAGGIYKFFS